MGKCCQGVDRINSGDLYCEELTRNYVFNTKLLTDDELETTDVLVHLFSLPPTGEQLILPAVYFDGKTITAKRELNRYPRFYSCSFVTTSISLLLLNVARLREAHHQLKKRSQTDSPVVMEMQIAATQS